MKIKTMLLLIIFIAIFFYVTLISKTTVVPISNQTSLPNPASKYCVEQGYNLTIRTNPDGSQTGYCIFPNGKECEEWTFFRGECKP
jgi:inhibitor of cysteine peptidase